MNRIIFIICLLWVCYLPVSAQLAWESHNSALKQAERYFEKRAYKHALALYHQVISKGPRSAEVIMRIANCYRLLEDPKNAVFWFGEALKPDDPAVTENWLHYASSLCKLRQYQLAKTWYEKYLQYYPKDVRALAALSSLNDFKSLFNPQFKVALFEIKGLSSVFSPVLYHDKLVFIGEGPTGMLARNAAAWSESPFLDLYYLSPAQGAWTYPHLMDRSINSAYHEGPCHFYDAGRQVILTRNSRSKNDEGTRNLQLMWSQRHPNGRWKKPRPLNISDGSVSMGHPTLDEDSLILYFVSDMPGGFGGTDLYLSHWVNGSWQKPQNLGPLINSPGNEMFPRFFEGKLFFASDGRGGLGGLDLFMADLRSGSPPENLGFPVNSSRDDFGMVWETSGAGYFSSNREGQDRIFRFQLLSP